MNTEFPKSENSFLKAKQFQDTQVALTYQGWEKKGNEGQTIKGKVTSWKDNLMYCLKYTYPEFAIDQTGEKRIGKDGQPFRNRYYDPSFKHGYSILYHFKEGTLESGSLPLWQAFCQVGPKPGELLIISRTGQKEETTWKVQRASDTTIKHAQAAVDEEIQLVDDGVPF